VDPARRRPHPPVTSEERQADFDLFWSQMQDANFALPERLREPLFRYGELVLERSALLNLVGPADRPRFFQRHVAECLHPALVQLARDEGAVVDIGSGAGLPGIPLALAAENARVLLVEPRLRKAQFLEAAIVALGLAGRVEVFQGSADKLILQSAGTLGAGLATARAVGRLPLVWGWATELLRPGGWLAVFKGPDEVAPEVAELSAPGPSEVRIEEVPGQPRRLLLLRRGPSVSRETPGGSPGPAD
jgi:16S rRNA (guanine527-N7)-methyltransferase